MKKSFRRRTDMLSEERYKKILTLLEEKKSITVTEITDLLGISESTARRDITALSKAGRLTKVFGGAVTNDGTFVTQEPTVSQKIHVQTAEKRQIARYAASLITDTDFIYLDAGTTTGCMIDFLSDTKASFVTNAVAHAQKLASLGKQVFLIGGELKGSTEAVIGPEAMEFLERYHFTKGFFGTNGITRRDGFTTPDAGEAQVKRTAMGQCRQRYIVADSTKFGNISAVTFAPFQAGIILTDQIPEGYEKSEILIECE